MAVASASAFQFWLSKTFRQIWRTVRKFWSGIFGGEIRAVNEVFGV